MSIPAGEPSRWRAVQPNMPRSSKLLPLLAGLFLAPQLASADSVEGARSELVKERSHVIDLRIDHGHAQMTVRRTVFNGGERHDQATFFIDLPESAVATGLRTKGTLRGRPRWFDGVLMEAEEAAAKYQELTGIGGYYPKDPALLSWRSQQNLALQVFPVAPSQAKTVEYTLTLPTWYSDGQYRMSLPWLGTDDLTAAVRVWPQNRRDQVFVNKEPVGTGTHVQLSADGVEIALARHDPPTIGGALASVPFGDGRVLTRYHVEAAATLSEVPRRARVVVVLDSSRSLDESDASAAVAAARSYLSHFSDAKVEVLTVARKVERRHGKLVPVRRALADLEGFELERENGSNLDAALTQADRILSRSRRHPRRIVVVTDLRTRSTLTPQRLRATLGKSAAIVHVATIASGTPELERDDDDPWAVVPRSTGGVLWRATASEEAEDRAIMHDVYEEWARPLRIDFFRASAAGLGRLEAPDSLDEGVGLDELRFTAAKVGWVKSAGELWSRPIRETILSSRAEGKRWAALVFGSNELGELSEPEMMVLATFGGAVSPVTSYLAIEPGVRPSTEGLDWGNGSGAGFGGGGGSGFGTIGLGGKGMNRFDHQAFLERQLRAAWSRCAGQGDAVVELESTLAEVVDVTKVEIQASDDVVRRCMLEASWDLALAHAFTQIDRRSWTVAL